jgi:hypothetical protein
VATAQPDWPSLSDDNLNKQLDQVRQEFLPIEPDKKIPWYIRNKFLSQGSQATLLVLRVEGSKDTDRLDVRAISVGDCCLLLFRGNDEVCAFPVSISKEFGVNPTLVINRPQPSLNYDRCRTQMQPGDFLLICTDAVGKWALECLESNQPSLLFESLLELLTPDISDSDPSVKAPSVEEPQSLDRMSAEDRPDEDNTKNLHKLEHSKNPVQRVSNWFKRILNFSGQTEVDEAATPDIRQTSESENVQPDTDDKNVSSDSPQPVTTELVSNPQSKFEQFIERYRAPEGQPHMRNDDSTLVICIPVWSVGADQQLLEVIKVIQRYRDTASRRTPEVKSIGDASHNKGEQL